MGAKVERISYGERIVLRPDPLPADRPYEKGWFMFIRFFLMTGVLMPLCARM